MMEWKEVRLGDVCSKVCSGGTPKSTNASYYGGNIPWLNTKEINFNRIYSTEKTITEDGLNNSSAKWVDADTVTIAMYGATAGKSCIIKVPLTTNQACCNLTIDKNKADHEMIFYALMHKYTELASLANGGAQQNLNAQIIKDFTLNLPSSVEDQRRIASILSSLDRKIELNNKINAQLEEMAQAIFKSWFVDFEPFKVGADGSAPTYGSGKFVESELGMIPEGWRVGTLDEVADINPKRTLKKGEIGTYLDMKNMPTSGSFPLLWEKKEMNGGMKFKNGDTLMARITPCLENGKVAYVSFLESEEVGFGSTEYIVMTAKDGKFPELLYFLCRHKEFVDYATKNMNGSSGRQRVSGETIGKYKMVIPPAAVFDKLAPIYRGIMQQTKVNGFESLHLSHLRDTLLPKLMNGEIEL